MYNQIFIQVSGLYGWDHELTTLMEGGINSIFIFSAIFGCFTFSFVKKFSRIKICYLCDSMQIIGSSLLFIPQTRFLVIGRVI